MRRVLRVQYVINTVELADVKVCNVWNADSAIMFELNTLK